MKSQNGEEKSKWNTWLWLFYFLAHFAFPIVKHWHVLKTAILTVVDMTILRYEERIVRLVQKETAEEKKKKKTKKRILEAESSRTFYIESVSLVNGKGDEFVGNRLYIREKFRALDAPFRNQLNRVIPL